MVELCEMCKLLNNKLKLEILVRVFESREGINVGYLADDMQNSGLGLSGVSQYLKQLERLGVVRRIRAGRYVNYEMDMRRADPKVRTAVEAIIAAVRKGKSATLLPVFGALMNPFRAGVVAAVAKAGAIPSEEICAKTEHQMKYLKRDLQAAVDAGLLDPDDSDTEHAIYHFVEPDDATVRLLVSLLS